MSKKTLEKVLEHLLNHEQEAAGELLHNYFVEKGRSIYENMIQSDEQLEESIGGDPVSSFEEEVMADHDEIDEEEMFSEDEEDGDGDGEEMGRDEMGDDMGMDHEGGMDMDGAADHDEAGESASVEDAMMNVEDAISALKAEFDKLVNGEEDEHEGDFGGEEDEHEGDFDGAHDSEDMSDEDDPLGESVDLKKVSVTHGDNGDAGSNKSPFSASFKKFETGAAPAKFVSADATGGKVSAPKQNPNSTCTTQPNVKPAPKPTRTDSSDKSARSTIAGGAKK